MARNFFTGVDLNKNELRQAVVHLLGADPGSPTEGQIWYNTVSHAPKIFNGTSNLDLTNPVVFNGQNAAYYLARANHTGTQTASTISDLATVVKAYRLDEFAVPTADVSLNSRKITNLANGVSASDAVNKGQLDASVQGFSWKDSVRVATTAHTSLTGASGTIDGVALSNGDRVLFKNQSSPADNGIRIYNAVGGDYLTRATDADSTADLQNATVFVDEGTTNAGTAWNQTAEIVTLETSAVTWVQFGAATTYSFTSPLLLSGNTVSLTLSARLTNNGSNQLDLASGIVTAGTYQSVTVDTYGRVTSGSDLISGNGLAVRTSAGTYTARIITGTSNRLTVTNGDGVSGNPTLDISSAYVGQATITTLGTITTGVWTGTTIAVANGGTGATTAAAARSNLGATGKYSALIGDGSSTSITITQATHGLANSCQNQVDVFDATTGAQIECDVTVAPATGNVTLAFTTAPASNAFRVVIIG
jgi:hypothetical protein